MNKSTITRERLQEIAEDGFLKHGESKELARMALAAMDSEPVAWTWHYREQWHVTNDKCRAEFVAKDGDVAVLPLYRHAQPSPEMKPVGYLFVSEQGAIAYSPTNWGMPGFRLIGQIYGDIDVESQPAPVVPEEMTPEMMRSVQLNSELGAYAASNLSGAYDLFAEFWKEACRAAMLQAEPVCTCPSGDGSLRWPCSVHPGNSPVIGIDVASGPDRTVEVRYVAPPGYVMVPKEPTEEMLQASYREASVYSPTSYRAMIAAAPQEAINALIPLVSRNEQEVKRCRTSS